MFKWMTEGKSWKETGDKHLYKCLLCLTPSWL